MKVVRILTAVFFMSGGLFANADHHMPPPFFPVETFSCSYNEDQYLDTPIVQTVIKKKLVNTFADREKEKEQEQDLNNQLEVVKNTYNRRSTLGKIPDL